MAYPFKREPELNESEFSILQHKAIEEIMELKFQNNREESLKLSLEWVEKTNAYHRQEEKRSTLEGLSKLYYLIACDLNYLEKQEDLMQYHQKSIESMRKCCNLEFSSLYMEELAGGLFQFASLLHEFNQTEKALSEAHESLYILNLLIEQLGDNFNLMLNDNKTAVEEFINELQSS